MSRRRESSVSTPEAFAKQASSPLRVLPGAQELLDTLAAENIPHAIATSGRLANARHALQLLRLRENTPVVTRDDVRFAKPDPDLWPPVLGSMCRWSVVSSWETVSGIFGGPAAPSRCRSGYVRRVRP
ncbi:MAG: HAD hydrolase-like protein [Nitrospiraceae bacterium]